MEKNDIFNAEITSVGSNGEGVCRINNMAVFVPYAVLGDKADIKILKVNKSYAFGKIEKITHPSPSRTEEKCSVFGKCGGCALQPTTSPGQLELKRTRVKDALERIGGFSSIEVMPCVESTPAFEYRNKAQYPVADSFGVAETGFYAPRSHRLVKMSDCALTDSDSKIIAKTIIDFANENKIKGYDEVKKSGCIRHIYTRHGNEEIIVVIVGAEKNFKKEDLLVKRLLGLSLKRKIVGIVYNYNPIPNNVILGNEHKILYGRSYIYDTLCGLNFKIDYKSFYQVNKNTTEKIYIQCTCNN